MGGISPSRFSLLVLPEHPQHARHQKKRVEVVAEGVDAGLHATKLAGHESGGNREREREPHHREKTHCITLSATHHAG